MKHLFCVALMALPGMALADQVQRKCTFERGLIQGGSFDTNLKVVIAIEGNRGAVQVAGSGTYQAKIRKAGDDIAFRTPVSSETIAVGPDGDALWQITFDDGRTEGVVLGYAGTCRKPR